MVPASVEDPETVARWRRRLLGFLAFFGVAVSVFVIPGAFSLDECAQLMTLAALREGGLQVPGTEGLPASKELFWFEPSKQTPRLQPTPVYPVTPPLYAPLALPFALLGWRGLVGLNTLCLLATSLLVLQLTRVVVRDWRAPMLATLAFTVGSYMLEYCQGLWPHMLSMFLCTLAYALLRRARGKGSRVAAALGGVVVGVSIGVRYPNLLFAGGLGLGLLRTRAGRGTLATYLAGLLPVLLVLAGINQVRLGVPNPVSKGQGYLKIVALPVEGRPPRVEVRAAGLAPSAQWAARAARSLLTFVVDFRFHPPLPRREDEGHEYRRWDPATRILTMGSGAGLGVPKKAWLQSIPWGYLSLLVLLAAWLPTPVEDPQGEELRALGAVVFPWLVIFACFGTQRYDGFCFNQRYFLDLVPLMAVALGVALEDSLRLSWSTVLRGTCLGFLLGGVALLRSDLPLRNVLLLSIPHGLGIALLLTRWRRRRRLFTGTLAATIAFAFCAHWREDAMAAAMVRWFNGANQALLERNLPPRAALVVYAGKVAAVGTLILDRDLVVLDPWADSGRTAPALIDALLGKGRTVVVLRNGMPDEVYRGITAGRRVERLPVEPATPPMEWLLRGVLGPASYHRLVELPFRRQMGASPDGPPMDLFRIRGPAPGSSESTNTRAR